MDLAAIRQFLFAVAALGCVLGPKAALAEPKKDPAAAVRAVLSLQQAQLDYAHSKIAFDQIVDPSVDAGSVKKEVSRLVASAQEFAGPRASEGAKIDAVRKVLYEAGPWNDHRPFTYDHDDPFGKNIRNKLLSTYLETRRGNCVSMPILFMIVGRSIGLNLTLTTAPHHVLVRYSRPGLHPFNIEATSGGGFARDEWYRQKFPMSNKAIANGVYLRTHSDRETVAVMAGTVLQHLRDTGKYEEVIKVAQAIRAANPQDATLLIWEGSANAMLLKTDFEDKYPVPALIPPNLRARYFQLVRANAQAFADAEALGWGETPQ